MHALEDLPFDNTYLHLPDAFHARLSPTPLAQPRLVSFNPDAAALIDLRPEEAGRPEFVEYLTGLRPLPGAQPLAMCYSGHQFGHYVPRLGDGRALLLGEVRNRRGEKWDLHLKGAGQTPYSRQGDGRAVLRSTIREYLCGEAMHGLGIPSSRGLCIIGSDEEVFREQIEPGAMLLRMAPSHVRFGHFEYFYYTDQFDHLQRLADYVITHHYPDLAGSPRPYYDLLAAVIAATARLISQWQAVGFAHGVMNTDNMSILGITLDYGPFGFLDAYDPGFVCNHSDHAGRYAFDQQPAIALFNLTCLAQAMLPLLSTTPAAAVEQAKHLLAGYQPAYIDLHAGAARAKLGLRDTRAEDQPLWDDLLALLAASRVDYTRYFRALAQSVEASPLRDEFLDRAAYDAWERRYHARLAVEARDPRSRQQDMQRVNPKYILRNHLAEIAIRQAQDQQNYAEIDRLLALLRRPYDEQPEMAAYAAPPPDWARGISVSCSS